MNQLKGKFNFFFNKIYSLYRSINRQIVGQLCGWSNNDTKSVGYDRMTSLIEQEQYEKVAALYIFQMNVNKALDVLNEGLQRGFYFLFYLK